MAGLIRVHQEVERNSGGDTSCWRGVRYDQSRQEYTCVRVFCKCYVVYWGEMALLRQRNAQGSNAAEIEKKIKR